MMATPQKLTDAKTEAWGDAEKREGENEKVTLGYKPWSIALWWQHLHYRRLWTEPAFLAK